MARCFETGVAWVVSFLNALGNKKTSKILIQKSKRCLIKLGGFYLRKEKGSSQGVESIDRKSEGKADGLVSQTADGVWSVELWTQCN